MDSLFGHGKPAKGEDHVEDHGLKHKHSTGELFASAKVVADAAFSKDKLDQGKVAGAAADLLGGASEYGKFEEKGYGKYVEKAETYLHQYHSTHTSTTVTNNDDHSTTTHSTTTTHASAIKPSSGDEGHSEGGFGDYFKMAEGFLKK